jgi:hypothetical protein
MHRSAILVLLTLSAVPAASPAHAQFPNILDSIFGNPPRPPSDVPSRPPYEPQYVPPSRQGIGPPPSQQTGLPPGPPPGRIQMQPLPPPPGGASAPPPQRMQPGAPPATPPAGQPANLPRRPAAPQQPEEAIIEPSANKVPNPTAVFAGLDKITGRIISFDVAINETVRFGALEVTPRACYSRPPTEQAQTDGFVEVDELTLQGELRRIFTGWMFAASPGLSAVEHPIYDIWLTECKGGTPPTLTSDAPPETAPAQPQRRQPAQRAQNPQQPSQPQQPQPRRTQQLPPPQGLPPPPQR